MADNKLKTVLNSDNVLDLLESMRGESLFSFIDDYMVGCNHVNFHCEGDVWTHTKLVIRNIKELPHDEIDLVAALLHDIGKKDALNANNGKNMHDHEIIGLPIARQVLNQFNFSEDEIKMIIWIIANHTNANNLVSTKSKYKCWKLVSHPWFCRLYKLAVADALSTLTSEGTPLIDYPAALRKNQVAAYCIDNPMPDPIVTMDDLMDIDYDFRKPLFDMCYKIQINGGIKVKESIIRNAMNCEKPRNKQ